MVDMHDPHRERLQNAVVALKRLQAQLDAAESAKREPIAIVGAGCRFPGDANDLDSFWRLLQDGVDTAGELPADRWDSAPLLDTDPYTPGRMFTRFGNYLTDVGGFDPQFFGIAPREAMSLDPQQRLLLEVSWEALENAGLAPDALTGSPTGVFVGMSVDDYAQFYLRSGDYADIDAYSCSGAGLCFGAGRISYVLGLHGPSMNVDTACASALTAIHLASQSLRAGECELALAGGVNLILTPEVAIGMSALRALSPDGRCKAFDASADGFGRGEGCGMVALKRLSSATAAGDRILAVILGSAVNHDGPSGGLMVPNGLAQEALLREALTRAAVNPADVQYIEAHGTGTALGDPIEVEALQAVYGKARPMEKPILLGSVKTNIGHLEAASGVAGLLKVVLSLQNREIPPHLHFQTPSTHIPWSRIAVGVPTERTPWPDAGAGRVAGVSAFGMSGTNVHVLVGEAPPTPARQKSQERPFHVLHLSAKTAEALQAMASQVGEYLDAHEDLDFGDVCHTANTGRAQFAHRMALVTENAAQARDKLAAFAAGEEAAGVVSHRVARAERPKVAFLFTGQGGQYRGMGRRLYETQPVFRRVLEECDRILRPHHELPLLEVLYPKGDQPTPIDETAYTQPALFAVEYALAELWRAWGVEPGAVLGHSVGEYVAACVAGMFTLEDGLRLVALRGRLMQRLPGRGAMAAVFADRSAVEAVLANNSTDVAIAAFNGPEETVISGESGAVTALIRQFETAGVKARPLAVSHAFHSPIIEPMLDEFEREAAAVDYTAPRIPVISNLTGDILQLSDLDGGTYWRRHARSPVQFIAGMRKLAEIGSSVFLEAGPKPSLAGLGRQILAGTPAIWLASLRKGQDDWKQMLTSLATLHVHGVNVDWMSFDREYGRRPVALPTYPFQRTRFWAPHTATTRRPVSIEEELHPLVQRRISLPLAEKVFESVLRADTPSYLADHRVRGDVVVPGSAYLEMASEAARQVLGEGSRVLEGVRFLEPLVLGDGVSVTAQLVLTPEDAGTMRFAIRRRVDMAGDVWSLHATGRISAAISQPMVTVSKRIDEARTRCGESMTPTEHYERFRRRGLEYGPAFQVVQDIRRAPGESLGQLGLPEPYAADAAHYQCHPALLDAALQVMAAGVADEFVDAGLGIPVAVERYCVYGPVTGNVWSHTVVHQNLDGSGVTGDAQILDDSGRVLVDVQGLRVARVGDGDPVPVPDVAETIYEVRWRRAEPAFGTGIRRWAIVADRGDVGQRLVTALEREGDCCSLIESVDELDGADCTDVVSLVSLGCDTALDVCHGTLRAVQPLTGRTGDPPRLWLVTRGAQRTGYEDGTISPEQASLWGLAAVVDLEHPEFVCTRVDLDPAADVAELSLLVRELRGGGGERRVALRRGDRYVARFVRREMPDAEGSVRLEQTTPGTLSSLAFRPAPPIVPARDEIAIKVHATGLNFRDVLNALDMYPGDAGSLGDECSGQVVAVGPGVEEFAVGDEVLALAAGSFGTLVTTPAEFAVHRLAALAPESAAGIPIAFLTARYALRHLARLQTGERVLIHAAAGGVGLAAVQTAQRMGAEVFGTAGSAEKRAFLQSRGVRHVFDSRSTKFGAEIRELTGGNGVDVVLSALGPEATQTSLELLAPGGRFVEIGNRHIWTSDEVAEVAPGAEYHVFHLSTLMRDEPAQVRTLLREIVDDLTVGRLEPLPRRVFGREQVVDAFRFMAQARHTGKIVVTQQPAGPRIRDDATYLITGGLGALGQHAASWLFSHGARHLVLLGRRAPESGSLAFMQQLEEGGAEVRAVAADVTSRDDLIRVLADIDASMPPLAGIIHAAGVLDDGLLSQQDRGRFARVLAPKVEGARNLNELTRDRPLDFFILYSSVVALAGTAGQGSYAAANAYLDALAAERRAQGLPALSVNWGAWAADGMASQVSKRHRRRWGEQGIELLAPGIALQGLDQLLVSGAAQAAVLPIRWDRYLKQLPSGADTLFYEEVVARSVADTVSPAPQEGASFLRRLEAEALPLKRRDLIAAFVRDQIVHVLGLDPRGPLDSSLPIREMGLDSLMAVEIRNALGYAFGEIFAASLLFDYPTLDALTDFLAVKAGAVKFAPVTPGGAAHGIDKRPLPAGVIDQMALEQVSEERAEAMLLDELESLNF